MSRFVRRTLIVCSLPAFLLCLPVAQSADDPLTLAAAVTAVLEGNPELALTDLDALSTSIETDRIKGMLDPRVSANIGVSEDETPVASDFQPERSRLAGASAGIAKPLASGAEVQAALDYNRSQQFYSSPLASQLARINPAYRGGISVQYRHPLARGANRPAYHDALDAAAADTVAGQRRREIVARDLALRALNGYYQLLSSDVSIRLAVVAVDRAERLLEYQQLRRDFGLIETADLRQAQALLATRAADLQEARVARDQHRVALNRLMRRDPATPLTLAGGLDITGEIIDAPTEAFERALEQRPEFRILDAQLDAAIARQHVTHDTARAQVDVIAEWGSMSLDRGAGNAATDAFGLDHHFAGLSLEIGETVGNLAGNAEYRQATLARERVLIERQRLAEQVRDELAQVHIVLETGDERLRLAVARVAAEQQKFAAETARYRDGRSDTATVIQFEGDLHQAELQAELLQLSLRLARHQLAWSTGTLLADLGVTLPSAGDDAR